MTEQPDNGLTRRRLLAGAGATGVGLGAGYLAGKASASDDGSVTGTGTVPFHGAHQAGITTAAQDRLHFAAFDLIVDDADALRDLLQRWTEAAEQMAAGESLADGAAVRVAPPIDTGETVGLLPSRLTITFGLGPTLFERDGRDRLGLSGRRPAPLAELPALPRDELVADHSGGDLCVQACADDPQVAFHAVRNLARIGRGTVVMRWSQLGFGRTSTTSSAQATPRNLMGFKDGTANIRAEDTDAMNEFVWAADPDWMLGGSYLVTRRIRMLLEVWDRTTLAGQEKTIGRRKESGAPLGGELEDDPLPLDARRGGHPVIPPTAHVRLASRQVTGTRILRRGYSFTDGVDERLGQLDAGLFFIAYQRDPAQFVAIQRSLGVTDELAEYIKHTSSAVFAVPPGIEPGGYVGEGLFA